MYLDHAATTPMRQVAIDAMLPFLADGYANPSGAHRFARQARRAVDDARDRIAEIVGCLPGEVVFTSGGTESDNAAISGAVWRHGGVPLCPATEHHGVLNVVERHNGRVVGVDRYGRADLEPLAAAIDDDVSIVSVMAVNNEVGSINDLGAVAGVVRAAAPNTLLHTDAVQAACWLDLRQLWPHVDLLSLSAHKFGGPKGVGVLVVRKGVTIDPLLVGGGQERDRRSGTHNVPGIVAMAAALAATDAERATECVRIAAVRDRLVGGLRRTPSTVSVRPSPPTSRSPVAPTSASTGSRASRCCSSSTRRASARRRPRPAPAGRWSRRTCSPPWASSGVGRRAPCG